MELTEIEKGVESSVAKWLELERMRQRPLELTNGAKKLVVQMIANIGSDPSPYWGSVELDTVQRFAVSTLPNILVEIGQRYRHFYKEQQIVSSWEILHDISRALDKWCPIPKDI